MNLEREYYYFACQHCGRNWRATGTRTGFVKSARNTHASWCKERTPAQRRAINRRDEARWQKVPPQSDIWNDPRHPGLKDKKAR